MKVCQSVRSVNQQVQIKEYQSENETTSQSRDEMINASKELEKKYKSLEAEFVQVQEDLTASERGRRDLQLEKDELIDHLASGNKLVSSLSACLFAVSTLLFANLSARLCA